MYLAVQSRLSSLLKVTTAKQIWKKVLNTSTPVCPSESQAPSKTWLEKHERKVQNRNLLGHKNACIDVLKSNNQE